MQRLVFLFLFLLVQTVLVAVRSSLTVGPTSGAPDDLLAQASLFVLPGCARAAARWSWAAPLASLRAAALDADARGCALATGGELFLFFGFLAKAAHTAGDLRRDGLANFLSGQGSTLLERTLSVAFILACVGWKLLPLLGVVRLSRPLLALACLLSWLYTLWFALGYKSSGQFVIVLVRMLGTDVKRFMLISSIFVAAFGTVFFILGKISVKRQLHLTMSHAFQSMVGGEPFSHEDLSGTHLDEAGFSATAAEAALASVASAAAAAASAAGGNGGNGGPAGGGPGDDDDGLSSSPHVLVMWAAQNAFLVGGSVMLMNLLIAMMGDTFSDVKTSTTDQALLERARIIRHIERSMTDAERRLPKHKYYGLVDGRAYITVEVTDPLLLGKPGYDALCADEARAVREAEAARERDEAAPAAEASGTPLPPPPPPLLLAGAGGAGADARARRRRGSQTPARSSVGRRGG